MVADLRYFNSLEHEVDSLKSQLETQKTQFLNEIDRLSRESYYADHMNAILGVYTTLDEFTDLQCDYVDQVVKCERLEKELSKSNITSKSFEALQQHAIDLELALQQYLKGQLQDKGIAIRVIPTTSVSRPQLKSNRLEDRVMHNNSDGKKQQVEDHHRNFKFSNNKTSLIKIIPFIVDSGCLKHMTRNLKLLSNFVEKFLGTMKFRNDQIASILGYGDLVQGNITIKRVYYVQGLNHNLFSIGQFYNANLKVAFQKSTCYIHDLKGTNLLTGSCGTDMYSITLQD
ncbi:hypothetical protein Tco_1191736 [Tanacetum coccineum]